MVPKEREEAERDEVVTLRNTQRRPLLFRVAGETVRLAPGESREVEREWLASSELQHFRASGVLLAIDPAADRAAAEEDNHLEGSERLESADGESASGPYATEGSDDGALGDESAERPGARRNISPKKRGS